MKKLNSRSGLTMVEAVIASTLFAMILTAFAMTTKSAGDYYEQGTHRARLEQRAHRVLTRILDTLPDAGAGTLTPPPTAPLGAATLEFQQCLGATGAVLNWGPVTRLEYAMDPQETDNGTDDNGDGLVDEGVISWVENPGLAGERRTVLCRNVSELLEGELPNGVDDNGNGLIDEAGLCFELDGSVLTVSVSVESIDPAGDLMVKTVSSAVRLRN